MKILNQSDEVEPIIPHDKQWQNTEELRINSMGIMEKYHEGYWVECESK